MPELNIDFEGGEVQDTSANTDGNVANQEDTTSLDGNPDAEDINAQDNNGADDTNNGGEEVKEGEDVDSSTGELNPGDNIEFDGQTYTVADNGDLLDDKGNVFKKANEVQAWLSENEVAEEDDDLSLSAIRNAIGIDVTDNNGNPVEFEDSAQGVKAYVDSVIGIKASEIEQAAINRLFTEMPLLQQFIDYVQLTGTPRGFGDIPDRSGIELDKNNEAQQIAIIKMAAQEFGNASLNDNYINYLKTGGGLYDEAKTQLENLVAKDKQLHTELQQRAEQARQEQQARITDYWQTVYDAINNRVIGGYKIPDTFVQEIDGRKVTKTPDDFYDYLSKGVEEDEEGNPLTGYQRDLNNLSDEDALNRELLDAWLMFTGGSYKDLVDMAVKENEVRKVIVKSKQRRNASTVKVVKAKKSKVNPDDIIF